MFKHHYLSYCCRILSRFSIKMLYVLIMFPLCSAITFASEMDQGMPWMSPLQKITASISGPVAQAAGVICIVIAGLGIAFGEGGSGVRKLFQVVMGLAIAFTAASIVAKLFGASSGVIF